MLQIFDDLEDAYATLFAGKLLYLDFVFSNFPGDNANMSATFSGLGVAEIIAHSDFGMTQIPVGVATVNANGLLAQLKEGVCSMIQVTNSFFKKLGFTAVGTGGEHPLRSPDNQYWDPNTMNQLMVWGNVNPANGGVPADQIDRIYENAQLPDDANGDEQYFDCPDPDINYVGYPSPVPPATQPTTAAIKAWCENFATRAAHPKKDCRFVGYNPGHNGHVENVETVIWNEENKQCDIITHNGFQQGRNGDRSDIQVDYGNSLYRVNAGDGGRKIFEVTPWMTPKAFSKGAYKCCELKTRPHAY